MTEPYQQLDISTWPRKQHFEFYQSFEQPYFQIACNLDAAKLYQYCKKNQVAFFSAYLFLTMQTINQITPFCYRIVDGQVRIYKEVTISVTVMANDQTLRFCNLPYDTEFKSFCLGFQSAKEKAIALPFITENFEREQAVKNTIYMSVIPWLSFTGYSHAIHSKDTSGIPRMVFGKMNKTDGKMPFTIDAHHALVDGVHVAQFFETLQSYFDSPQDSLK